MSCDGCIKYLLFIFNAIFSLTGIALIVVGSLILSNTTTFSDLISDIDSNLKTPQVLLIILGVIIFVIATLGCCGAIRENRCMLILFGICLLSIFVVQLAIGIYALTHKDDFNSKVEAGLQREFAKIGEPETRKIFERMERSMQCCGVKGSFDYINVQRAIPLSCCEDKSDCKIWPARYWTRGCASALTNFTGSAGETAGGVAIGLSIIELLGAIFAFRLASQIRG